MNPDLLAKLADFTSDVLWSGDNAEMEQSKAQVLCSFLGS